MNLGFEVDERLENNSNELECSTKMLDLAWAEGFTDGEGCIHILKQKYGKNNKVCYRLKFCVGQNNLEVLERFQEILGIHAKIFTVKRTHATNKQCYTLNYDGKHAFEAVMKLRPYLLRKRYEADAAEKFWYEGKVESRTGRKPVEPELMRIRKKWYRKMQKLK